MVIVFLSIFIWTYVHGLGNTLPTEIGGEPDIVVEVPSTGVEGFPVAEFCHDDLTEVLLFPAPDAAGSSYQLTRVKEGVTETVVVVLNAAGDISQATHYHDTPQGQVSQPALIDDDARECIEEKRR